MQDSDTTRFVIVALVVLAVVAGGGIGLWLNERRRRREIQRLAETLAVHAKWWRERRKAKGELTYVAMGDSAAQGIGASKPHRSYVGLIARQLRLTSGQSVRVINLSQSGARLREVLAKQLPELAKLEPDILTVSAGANDIADFDAARFAREVTELCSALPPGTLIADLPCFFVGRQEKDVRIANVILRRVAAEHLLTVVPLYATTRRKGFWLTALRNVAGDYFHPNDRGYRVWASAFLPLLPAVVSDIAET